MRGFFPRGREGARKESGGGAKVEILPDLSSRPSAGLISRNDDPLPSPSFVSSPSALTDQTLLGSIRALLA